jgi:hypothetical protein
MFGSDQMRWPEKIGEAIEALEQAPFLTEEQKRDILYHNAVRFLRLEQAASKGGHSKRRAAQRSGELFEAALVGGRVLPIASSERYMPEPSLDRQDHADARRVWRRRLDVHPFPPPSLVRLRPIEPARVTEKRVDGSLARPLEAAVDKPLRRVRTAAARIDDKISFQIDAGL